MNKTKITIVITGGTIDSEWDPAKDTATVTGESSLPDYFERIKPESIDITFVVVCMKDSRELTPQDIKNVCNAVDATDADKVIVTHGTYTMPDTARYLEQNMKTKKAVILTGSMIPLKGYDMSDAPFNLGFAIASLLNIETGVCLAMNAQIFKPSEVAKNMSEGRFFSIVQ